MGILNLFFEIRIHEKNISLWSKKCLSTGSRSFTSFSSTILLKFSYMHITKMCMYCEMSQKLSQVLNKIL